MRNRNTEDPRLGLDPLDTSQEPPKEERQPQAQSEELPSSRKTSSKLIRHVSIGVLCLLMVLMLGWHVYKPLQGRLFTIGTSHAALTARSTRTSVASVGTLNPVLAADHARVQVLTQSVSEFEKQTASQITALQQSIAPLKAAQQQADAQLNELHVAFAQNNTADLTATVSLLQTQVADLNQKVQAIKTQAAAPKALPVTALPFQPLSVNSLGGMSYVLINMSNEDRLVRQGDTVQGWTLSSVDYPTQTVVFEDGQHHVARLVL